MQPKCIYGIGEGKKGHGEKLIQRDLLSKKKKFLKDSLVGSTGNACSPPHRKQLVEGRETKSVEQQYSWETLQSILLIERSISTPLVWMEIFIR